MPKHPPITIEFTTLQTLYAAHVKTRLAECLPEHYLATVQGIGQNIGALEDHDFGMLADCGELQVMLPTEIYNQFIDDELGDTLIIFYHKNKVIGSVTCDKIDR